MPTKKPTVLQRQRKPQDFIYCLKISLPGTEPLVWRRVLVPGNFTLEMLHSVFQLAMGWQMSHLYEFEIGGQRYADADEFDETPCRSPAASLASAIGDSSRFTYTYDFGDDWRHEIIVEEFVPRSGFYTYPVCIAGENACPPEDCHGIGGYEELKTVITDPNHREHEDTLRWLGGHFDPTSFDANRINRDMLWMIDWKRGPNDQGLYLPHNADEDSEFSEDFRP